MKLLLKVWCVGIIFLAINLLCSRSAQLDSGCRKTHQTPLFPALFYLLSEFYIQNNYSSWYQLSLWILSILYDYFEIEKQEQWFGWFWTESGFWNIQTEVFSPLLGTIPWRSSWQYQWGFPSSVWNMVKYLAQIGKSNISSAVDRC